MNKIHMWSVHLKIPNTHSILIPIELFAISTSHKDAGYTRFQMEFIPSNDVNAVCILFQLLKN